MFPEDISHPCHNCESLAKQLEEERRFSTERLRELGWSTCDRADLRRRLEEAEGLLNRAARGGELSPGKWLELQLEIAGFLTPTPPAEPGETVMVQREDLEVILVYHNQTLADKITEQAAGRLRAALGEKP